jgi:hypothetical protein
VPGVSAQGPSKPLSKNRVLEYLKGEVSPARVTELVRQRGIDFETTPEIEKELRSAGATDALLSVLRDFAPKRSALKEEPAPPALLIQSSPGGAQVFVDDELIARTSAKGRLRVPVKPGDHRVRLALEGYLDYEQTVSVVAGTAEIRTSLTSAASRPGRLSAPTGSAPAPKPPADVGQTSLTGPYKCEVPTCQKELFDSAMKRIAANPNNARAYFSLAQDMCPKINLLILGRPLPDDKLDCPDGSVQALKKYLELAPVGGLAPMAKKFLAAMGEPLGTPVAGGHRPHRHKNLAVAASQPSSTTNNGGSGETPTAENPSTHALPPRMMDGVYVGLRYQTATYHISPSVDYNFLIFSPKGVVSQNFPQEGLDGGGVRNQPAWSSVGQYRVNGNRVEIQWQRPAADHWSVTRDDSGADPQTDHYIPICRCNGARFSGTYLYGRNSVQFLPDGRFVDYGALDFMQTLMGNRGIGRGTYRIQNYTIYLAYDDGRQLRKSFAVPAVEEGHPNFRWILIAQNMFREQNYQRELYQKTPSGLNFPNRQ